MPSRAGRGAAKEHFEADLTRVTDECKVWPYGYSRNRQGKPAYGVINYKGKAQGVHVLACEYAHGPMPAVGMEAAHSCGVQGCWNFAHVSWKNKRENEDDKLVAGTLLRGSQHPESKLTDAQVLEIRARWASKPKGQLALAQEFGISQSLVSLIVLRKGWKHL